MAEDEEEVSAEEPVAGGGKRKKLIIIGAAVVVLLAAVGGGAFWFLSGSDEPPPVVEEGAEVVEEEKGSFARGAGKAIYYKLKPDFVTTFEANSRQRYVQLEVTLVTRDEAVLKDLRQHQPLIRNALVMLIAEQDYLELQTQEGKAALRDAAVVCVQDILKAEIGIPGIDQVLFTEFVMQ